MRKRRDGGSCILIPDLPCLFRLLITAPDFHKNLSRSSRVSDNWIRHADLHGMFRFPLNISFYWILFFFLRYVDTFSFGKFSLDFLPYKDDTTTLS
jgi:hypothetical protein